MKKILFLLSLPTVLIFSSCGSDGSDEPKKVTVPSFVPTSGYATPETYDGMDLIWQDEFTGSSLSSTNWNYEIGTGNNGWGNNELQYYTSSNTSVVGDDFLVITALEAETNGSDYSSSRITTQDKFEFKYGRIDIRASLPEGKGLWPALWMLGANFSEIGWPNCGEIDIMESGKNGNDDKILGTIHWDDAGNYAAYGSEDANNSPSFTDGELADEFHVYSITWDSNSIEWYVDDVQYHSVSTTSSRMEEFKEEFFFIFNVAVGGNFPGSPDATTTFPQRMIVDYIRVFQDAS